ncbi:YceI family protein [Saccharobesus litoralis]|uniref:YceI family protein n=1 Tax=Saccharobesus litoralis TaxID=2172099 RepID=A0A2S0VS60_9ALTE|nr:YceI family protein [Saccharobesus litoralis]AWB67044.1 YceI family protein [Saccharobesus litoralis]
MNKTIIASVLALGTSIFSTAQAADYKIDTRGAHASIEFKIKHLGYSWLTGRFNRFEGDFSYDAANPEQAKISVTIDPASIDSNHAERDKHLRGRDFLAVNYFKESKFNSSKIEDLGNGKLKVYGDFTLHGVTKPIVINAEKVGEGKDPWGGYRVGFTGTTEFKLADYDMTYDLGPASANIFITLNIEGIKK